MADLQSIAGDLYGVPLDEFITTRTERYEAARDDDQKALARQIKALRKPHAAAWALNMMFRERLDLIQDVIDLGDDLREAQAASDGSTIRRLDLTRRELMKKMIREATYVANQKGLSLSAAASDGMEQTLWAAMLDPDAAGAVLTGLLVAPIAAGMEASDLDGIVAIPDTSFRRTTQAPDEDDRKDAVPSPQEVEAATRDVEAKEELAAEARRQANAISRKQKGLHTRLERLEEDREELREQLRALEEDIAALEQDVGEVDHDGRAAVALADQALQDLTRAKARHDALDRS